MQQRMSLNEPWWSVRAHRHKTMRAGGTGRRKWGNGEGAAGIQLTGTSFQYHLEGDYPVCRDKRGEGQMRHRSKKINRSELTDKGLDLLPVLTE